MIDAAAGRAVRLVAHRRLEAPRVRLAEQLREEQGVGVADVGRRVEQRLDVGKEPRIVEGR